MKTIKMTGRSYIYCLFVLFAGLGFSCTKSEKAPDYSMYLETLAGEDPPSTLSVDSGGDVFSFMVRSNPNALWNITLPEKDTSWVKISPDVESEKSVILVKVDSNETSKERNTKLIGAINNQQFVLLSISQKGSDPSLEDNDSYGLVLDVIFNEDGSAKDASIQEHEINTLGSPAMTTVYSNAFQRFMGRFRHTPGGSTFNSGFYRIDYSSDQELRTVLQNGHSIEAIFMLNIDHPLPDEEMKMFCSHQSGGTGLMIGNASRENSIVFLPHIGGRYIWTNSNIVPERGKYYDVVGVWDKEKKKTFIYVNGELKDSQSASGDFDFPSAGSQWFAIGADPSNASANRGWNGDVVAARIYDKPLDEDQVKSRWREIKDNLPGSNESNLSDAFLISRNVNIGGNYVIASSGFKEGDELEISSVEDMGETYTLEGIATSETFGIEIPVGFVSGKYRFNVLRNGERIDIGSATLTVVDEVLDLPQIVAHRGWWKKEGAAQNSIASLIAAQELGIYGSETDTWITADGVLVINHDATINGVNIESASYSQIKDMTLSNGEKIPTLENYLDQIKSSNSNTKLILEIKKHVQTINGEDNNHRAAIAVDELVRSKGLLEKVEYISFSIEACKKLKELEPDAEVAYLTGTSPQDLYDLGLTGIDFRISEIKQHPEWIGQAHDLGMKVNVWTVDSEGDMVDMINLGVDFITTNFPVLLQDVLKKY